MACCGVAEEARLVATFEEHLVRDESLGCQQRLNYLLCWPCDGGQQYFYDVEANELSVCRSFCDDLYGHCRGAGFKGAKLRDYIADGTEFCELLRANVVSGEEDDTWLSIAKEDAVAGVSFPLQFANQGGGDVHKAKSQ